MPAYFPEPRSEEDRTGEVTWQLVGYTGPSSGWGTAATGSTAFVPDASNLNAVRFPLEVPADLADGEYVLHTQFRDVVDGRELRSESSVQVRWDSVLDATLTLDDDALWPAKDNYEDAVNVRLTAREDLRSGVVEVLDENGAVVRTVGRPFAGAELPRSFRWDGHDDLGAQVPAGTYTVRASLVDRAGNEGIRTQRVEVHDERLTEIVWSRTLRAEDTVVNTSVGRCSDLRTPSSRGDRASFQLASQTRCTTASQSHVIALSGIYLPESIGHDYRDISLQMRGGPSRGERGAYVVLGYVEKGDRLDARTVLRGAYGAQRKVVPTNRKTVVRIDDDGRRFLLWQAGLSEGSRWDVQSYTLRMRITVLR